MNVMVSNYASRYFATMNRIISETAVTDKDGKAVGFDDAVARFAQKVVSSNAAGGKVMFVGNGGSATIASHMGIDFSKNGKLRATAFNDAAYLTCLGNDLGYDNVFGFQVNDHANATDVLVAISSSGKSGSILNAVTAARGKGAHVITLSGFGADNPLRKMGDLNFHIPSMEYGYVELLHCAICHCALDSTMGTATD
jgi:D-sedoheptulose 7-phosphate isomerase